MTRQEAVAKLKAERTVTTAMLEPLGIPFEWFLRFAQLQRAQADHIIRLLLDNFDEEGS